MVRSPRPAPIETIRSALTGFERIRIEEADEALFSRFRTLAPQLVSCLDGDGDARRPNVLAAYIDGTPAGVATWVARRNACRKVKANLYARIDLVIVAESHRRLGIARLLTLSTLVHLADTHGERLYSVSCLAAHQAMEVILEELGFTGEVRPGQHFKHESIRVDQSDFSAWGRHLAELLGSAARMTNYRIRQHSRDA